MIVALLMNDKANMEVGHQCQLSRPSHVEQTKGNPASRPCLAVRFIFLTHLSEHLSLVHLQLWPSLCFLYFLSLYLSPPLSLGPNSFLRPHAPPLRALIARAFISKRNRLHTLSNPQYLLHLLQHWYLLWNCDLLTSVDTKAANVAKNRKAEYV